MGVGGGGIRTVYRWKFPVNLVRKMVSPVNISRELRVINGN